MNYWTSFSEKHLILKPLFLCPLGISQFGSRWWAALCRGQRDKRLTSLTCEDLWPAISPVCGLGSGPATACHPSDRGARPPAFKPGDDYSSRWHLIVAVWETLSQRGPSPDPPLLHPSCLRGVRCPVSPVFFNTMLTSPNHRQSPRWNQFFLALSHLKILFISPVGKPALKKGVWIQNSRHQEAKGKGCVLVVARRRSGKAARKFWTHTVL